MLAFCPAALVALIALRPVVDRRLSGFNDASGLPSSWVDRYHNLTTYFWPQMSQGLELAARSAAGGPDRRPQRHRARLHLHRERLRVAALERGPRDARCVRVLHLDGPP